jgi:integrase
MARRPRAYKRLTDRKIAASKTATRLADGDGLYLIVENESSKHWVFEYQFNGKRRYMGLGSARYKSLAEAREDVTEYRKLKAKGVDPLLHKRATRAAEDLEAAKAVTFEEAATRYIEANRAGWDSRHAQQWKSTLEQHAYPVLGHLSVQAIDMALVLSVVEPIWVTANVTATRVRGRIEKVLDWATTMKLRTGENPARWQGHLANTLPKPKKIHRVKSHASMPWKEVPAFMKELAARNDVGAAALRFLILTAGRKNEVVEAKWDEIDLNEATWTVPAERMKNSLPHRVPLSPSAIEILTRMRKQKINEFMFCATLRGTQRISDAVMGRLLGDMGRDDVVPHGFRSSFRTWAGDKTNFQREVIEKALAHTVGDETERAYDRGDLFEKRRKLMTAWAEYCSKPAPVVKAGDNVVEMWAG